MSSPYHNSIDDIAYALDGMGIIPASGSYFTSARQHQVVACSFEGQNFTLYSYEMNTSKCEMGTQVFFISYLVIKESNAIGLANEV